MNRNKFLNNNRTDHSYNNVVVSSEDVTESTILAMDASEAIHACETEFDLYKTGLESRDKLETHIEAYKTIENSNNVNAGSALLAKTGLESICIELGASSSYYSISNEDIAETPLLALSVAIESSESLLDTIIRKLREFASFIAKSVNKATLSIMTALSRTEKSSESFLETLSKSEKEQKLDDDVKGYPSSVAKGIKSKFGTIIAVGGGKELEWKDLNDLITDTKNIKDNFKQLQSVTAEDIVKGSARLHFKVRTSSKLYSNPNKYFADFPTGVSVLGKMLTRYDGGMGRMLLFGVKDNGNAKITYFEGTIKRSEYENAKLEKIIEYSKLSDLAEASKDIATNMKDIKKAGDDALEKIKKVADDAQKASATSLDNAKSEYEKDGTDKEAYETLKSKEKVNMSAIEAYVHGAPKAILDSTWMTYRTANNLLWLAQKTYGLYK